MAEFVVVAHLAAFVALAAWRLIVDAPTVAWYALFPLVQAQAALVASFFALREPNRDDAPAPVLIASFGLPYGVVCALAVAWSQLNVCVAIAALLITPVVGVALPVTASYLVALIAWGDGWRWTNDPRPGPPVRFSLRDAFFTTAAAAVALAGATLAPRADPLAIAAVAWIASLTAAFLGLAIGAGPRPHAGLVLAGLTFAAVFAHAAARSPDHRDPAWTLALASPAAITLTTLLALRLAGWRIDRAPP